MPRYMQAENGESGICRQVYTWQRPGMVCVPERLAYMRSVTIEHKCPGRGMAVSIEEAGISEPQPNIE